MRSARAPSPLKAVAETKRRANVREKIAKDGAARAVDHAKSNVEVTPRIA
jgi:hypothetical protein